MEPWGPDCIQGFAAVRRCMFRVEEAPAQSSLVSRDLLRAEGEEILYLKQKKNLRQTPPKQKKNPRFYFWLWS